MNPQNAFLKTGESRTPVRQWARAQRSRVRANGYPASHPDSVLAKGGVASMMPPSEPSSSTWDDPAPRIRLLFDAAACIEAAGGPAGTVASLRHFASRCHLGLAVPGEYGKALTLAASALGDTEVSA